MSLLFLATFDSLLSLFTFLPLFHIILFLSTLSMFSIYWYFLHYFSLDPNSNLGKEYMFYFSSSIFSIQLTALNKGAMFVLVLLLKIIIKKTKRKKERKDFPLAFSWSTKNTERRRKGHPYILLWNVFWWDLYLFVFRLLESIWNNK